MSGCRCICLKNTMVEQNVWVCLGVSGPSVTLISAGTVENIFTLVHFWKKACHKRWAHPRHIVSSLFFRSSEVSFFSAATQPQITSFAYTCFPEYLSESSVGSTLVVIQRSTCEHTCVTADTPITQNTTCHVKFPPLCDVSGERANWSGNTVTFRFNWTVSFVMFVFPMLHFFYSPNTRHRKLKQSFSLQLLIIGMFIRFLGHNYSRKTKISRSTNTQNDSIKKKTRKTK